VSNIATNILTLHQRLPTSGARRVTPFALDGDIYLAIPQLAEDVPEQDPHMNAGNSDVDTIIYRWHNGRFEEAERLRVPGGEDAAFFSIGDEQFLATASIRNRQRTVRSQHIIKDISATVGCVARVPGFRDVCCEAVAPTFALTSDIFWGSPKVSLFPGAEARHPRQSRIFEWDGTRFIDFQTLDGCWGYGWSDFVIDGERYLVYADHATASLLYRWSGSCFAPVQTFADRGGRAFLFFEVEGVAWLAFANLTRRIDSLSAGTETNSLPISCSADPGDASLH